MSDSDQKKKGLIMMAQGAVDESKRLIAETRRDIERLQGRLQYARQTRDSYRASPHAAGQCDMAQAAVEQLEALLAEKERLLGVWLQKLRDSQEQLRTIRTS